MNALSLLSLPLIAFASSCVSASPSSPLLPPVAGAAPPLAARVATPIHPRLRHHYGESELSQ